MGRSKDLATGTFTTALDVQGAITSDGLTVDTSDQVIINHSGDAGGLRIDSTNNTNTGSIRFGDVADNYIGAVEYNHSTNALSFYANNATRMTINSSGHVQMPYQPAWCLQPNHSTTSYSSGDTQIPFVSGVGSFGTFIQGGVTANSSGRVTIPVAGKYFCHVSFRQENVSTNMQLSIWKNGTYLVRGGIWYNSEVYENISIARTFDLAANDYLEVKINLGVANNIAGYNDRLTFFSGFMIG